MQQRERVPLVNCLDCTGAIEPFEDRGFLLLHHAGTPKQLDYGLIEKMSALIDMNNNIEQNIRLFLSLVGRM